MSAPNSSKMYYCGQTAFEHILKAVEYCTEKGESTGDSFFPTQNRAWAFATPSPPDFCELLNLRTQSKSSKLQPGKFGT